MNPHPSIPEPMRSAMVAYLKKCDAEIEANPDSDFARQVGMNRLLEELADDFEAMNLAFAAEDERASDSQLDEATGN